jgi:hypothetical protein
VCEQVADRRGEEAGTRMIRRTSFGAATALIAVVVGPASATAGAEMLVKVRSAGLPAKTCQYCHTQAVPTKETYAPDELNPRGRWLLDDKHARRLKAVDLQKLKAYPGGVEQK